MQVALYVRLSTERQEQQGAVASATGCAHPLGS